MDIGDVIVLIKAQSKAASPKFRRHFIDMVRERELDIEKVQQIWEKGAILGITYQGEDVYKVILSLSKDKDLNIIVGVSEQKKDIRLISVFPSETMRRVKHGKG